MNNSLHPDLQGKTLEEIIVNPTLWAKRIEVAVQKGTDAFSDLQLQLSKIEGPVARARECHILLALDKPEQAAQVIEGETHSLCRAMHLAVKMYYATLANYLYIIEQPEILTRDCSALGLESQMRWDFMRAQSFQQSRYSNEALHYHILAHRIANSLGVNSIAQVSEAQIQCLSPLPLKHRIETFSIQLQEIKKNEDFRVKEYILENLCVLYFLDDDLDSLRKHASELLPHILLDHTILLTDFFLGLPPSAQIHRLDQSNQNDPFCASGFLLSVVNEFKSRTYIFKDHLDFQDKLKPVLDAEIPDNLNVPVINLIMWSIKVMAHTAAKDTESAQHAFSQIESLVEQSKVTDDLPGWAVSYLSLTKAFLAYSNGEDICVRLREDILVGFETSTSFTNFVTQLFPDIVFWLHSRQRTTITEHLMGKVLWFEPISEYLSNHPDVPKSGKNITESDILKSKINILENRLEEAKDEHDIRGRDCSLYGLCVLSALNDDYPAFMEHAKGFTESALKDHLILFAKFFANENPGYQLPESFGPEDQPFYSLARLLLTFKQYNWHYRNSHHNPEYENMRNSILNWKIPETLDVPLTNLMSLTLKILVYLMNWDVKTPKPLMQKMRDIMKTVKLTEAERYYVWLAEGMLEYQTKQRMKSMYVSIIEKGIEKQKSFQWFVVQTCPQILIYLEKHGKSKVVKKLAKDTLKRWAGPSGPRWA